MKKSEMEEILFNKMKTFWNFQDVADWDIREQAGILLELVEESGMLPPFYTEFDRSLGESKILVKNYKWEQEDPSDDNYDKIRSGCK